MYYYRARYYSPALGRFLQTDPIGYEDSLNLYAYVGNDPVNGTDPSGEFCFTPTDSKFCGKSQEYQQADGDARIGLQTRFFGATSGVTNDLASIYFNPFMSGTTIEWLDALSDKLYRANSDIVWGLKGGKDLPPSLQGLRGVALDNALVHFEQSIVEEALMALSHAEREKIVNEINGVFDFSTGYLQILPRAFGDGASIRAAADKLGRTPRFESQQDREAIGREAVAYCRAMGRLGACY